MLDVASDPNPTVEDRYDSGRPASAADKAARGNVTTAKNAVFLLQDRPTIGPARAREHTAMNDVAAEKRARHAASLDLWLALRTFAGVDDVEPGRRGSMRWQHHDGRLSSPAPTPEDHQDPDQGSFHSGIVAGVPSKNETAAKWAAVSGSFGLEDRPSDRTLRRSC